MKPESKPALDEMGKLLKSDRQLKVYIVGHTDNQGTLATNLDLSQRRADAVVKALVGNYQIDSTHLAPKGLASLAPVASNTDEKGPRTESSRGVGGAIETIDLNVRRP